MANVTDEIILELESIQSEAWERRRVVYREWMKNVILWRQEYDKEHEIPEYLRVSEGL